MFENLTEKFNNSLKQLSGQGKISESNIREAMEDVRTALLEADVHIDVADKFCQSCTEQAVGTEVLSSLKPGQQMIKIVYDQLVELMSGGDEDYATKGSELLFVSPGPTVIMMCGLQGSGKTTSCGKLATILKQQGKKVMLCAADLQRPAAVEQLRTLANQVQQEGEGSGQVDFYAEMEKVAEYGKAVGAAVDVCKNAFKKAKAEKHDVLILDTAGRLHINDELMGELKKVNRAVQPHQILLVIDAMTGQDAVNSARAFNNELELDGVIITKFDSDTRGGAALTVRQITGKPIKFVGVGEKLADLQPFKPERIAGRILDMGDILTLVEDVQKQVTEEEAEALQRKMEKGKLTFDDFMNQMKTIRKMGNMKSLMGMLPGIGTQMKDLDLDDDQFKQTEAIISSMTKDERANQVKLDNSRRRRVAKGSGTKQTDVSQLIKGFDMVSQMSKQMSGMNMLQRMKTLSGLGGMAPGMMGGGAPDLSALAGTKKGKPAPKRSGGKRRKRRSR